LKNFPIHSFVLHIAAILLAAACCYMGQRFDESALVFAGGIAFAVAMSLLKETATQFKAALAREPGRQ
jgi:hypothetical protein